MKNKKATSPINFLYRITAFALVFTRLGLAQSSSRSASVPDLLPSATVTVSDGLPPAPFEQDAVPLLASAPASNINYLFDNPFAAPGAKPSSVRVLPLNLDYLRLLPNPFDVLLQKLQADDEAQKRRMNDDPPPRRLLTSSAVEHGNEGTAVPKRHEYDCMSVTMARSEHFWGYTKGLNDNNWGEIVSCGGRHMQYFIGAYDDSYRKLAWGGGIEVSEPLKINNFITVRVGVLFALLPKGYNRQEDPIEPGVVAPDLDVLFTHVPFRNHLGRFFSKIPGAESFKNCSIGLRLIAEPPGSNNGPAVINSGFAVHCRLQP